MRLALKSSLLAIFFPIFLLNLISAQDIQTSETQAYTRGLDLYEQGFFEEAVLQFQTFSENHPAHEMRISSDFYLARALTGADSSKIESY
ncbi:MAG TPA: hypothetical protein DD671_18680, partial [Balneolaceae bacterium]|nr:hypothetical protein [Balneolaceae bacterium]